MKPRKFNSEKYLGLNGSEIDGKHIHLEKGQNPVEGDIVYCGEAMFYYLGNNKYKIASDESNLYYRETDFIGHVFSIK